MPKVSVVVPVYNADEYLRECLDSLINQTLKDIEIICVNDGSTDNSPNIINEYASNDSRFIVINKENTGYGHSMNLGLMKATGDYIGILESDDFAETDMFEQLYEAAIRHKAEVVKSNYFYYECNNGIKAYVVEILKDCSYNQIFSPLENKNIFYVQNTVWSAIYNREFLSSNMIRFNETPGASYQDIGFSFQVWACARRVFLLENAYIFYRQDNANSSVKSPSKIYCVCDEFLMIDKFLDIHKEIKDILLPVKVARQFNIYKWNYNRLVSTFQYEFYKKMVSEFMKIDDSLYNRGLWFSEDWEDWQRIKQDPYRYFEETAKDDYRDERISLYPSINKSLIKYGLLYLIEKYKYVALYGAGIIGGKVAHYLINNGTDIEKLNFVVTSNESNVNHMMGIPVDELGDFNKPKDDTLVLVTAKESFQLDILKNLSASGYQHIVTIDRVLLGELSDNY